MRIDELPAQFKAFVNQAREVLDWEVSEAQKSVAASNDEKSSAETTLSDLHTQIDLARKQLNSHQAYLDRASTLAGLDHEITADRKKLAALKAEIEKVTEAKAVVEKQLSDTERKLVASTNELTLVEAVFARNQNLIAEQRAKWCS